jgi:hypothetical protein
VIVGCRFLYVTGAHSRCGNTPSAEREDCFLRFPTACAVGFILPPLRGWYGAPNEAQILN